MKKHEPLIVGNWKLNPTTLAAAEKLAANTATLCKNKAAEVVIAPPALYLEAVHKKIKRGALALAAQNVSPEPLGAFTGEISALQLRDIGAEYVIIGHSERRAMGETDKDVQVKIAAALKNKLTPIICIGERERDANGDFFNVIQKQIQAITDQLDKNKIKKVVIAYEPIWAIGSGKTATPEDVKEMQLYIYSILAKAYDRLTARKVRLLYGGSVKPANALELHTEGGMDGFLVGGASLKADDFSKIITHVTT